MIEPVKVSAPIAAPKRHLDAALRMDFARRRDAECIRRIEGCRRHEHRRQADERMERRDELRHRRHGDAPRRHRTNGAADAETGDDENPRQHAEGAASANVVKMAIAMPIMP